MGVYSTLDSRQQNTSCTRRRTAKKNCILIFSFQNRISSISSRFYWYYILAYSTDPNCNINLSFPERQYYVFNTNTLEPGYPKPLTHLGLPSFLRRIDAAFIWGHNQKTYLFSGTLYWRYDEDVKHIELDYPRDMSIWQGIGYHIDGAMQYLNGKITQLLRKRVLIVSISFSPQVKPTFSKTGCTGNSMIVECTSLMTNLNYLPINGCDVLESR